MSLPCGGFYGTPVSTLSPTANRHLPGSTPVGRTRNDGTINEKLDQLLSTFEEEKRENTQLHFSLEKLSSQVAIL